MLLVVLPGLLAGRAGRLAGQGGEAVSAAVAKFVRSQRLPKPQAPRLLLAVPDQQLEVFAVSYGEPQDCMVGCFYSWLSGLRFAGKIGWMDCDRSDHSRFDHPITCFDVDSTDRYLFTADLLARLDHLEEPAQSYSWLARSVFRPMLVRDPDTPVAVLERFARELYAVAPDQFMERLLFENTSSQTAARRPPPAFATTGNAGVVSALLAGPTVLCVKVAPPFTDRAKFTPPDEVA